MTKVAPTALLFVYGTLLEGQVNHVHLGGAACQGKARTAPGFHLVNLGSYPAMVRCPPGEPETVTGELYAVGPEVLAALDDLEGHPDYYRREEILLADGRRVLAYLLPAEQAVGFPLIGGGDWRGYL